MGHIDGMVVQSSGSKPHVVFIMETLARTFPYCIWKLGGRVVRDTSDGKESFHATGRACDVYLDAFDPLDLKLGDLLFRMFHTEAVALKVHHVIWNRHIWSRAEGGPRYFSKGNGGAHTNHIHVAFEDPDLTSTPVAFPAMCQRVLEEYAKGHDGEGDRVDGIYGKAFDPRRPLTRLTLKQRGEIMKRNMGFSGL